MKKVDLTPPVFALPPVSAVDLGPARRLIVLVPEIEMDLAYVARKLGELTNSFNGCILFYGLCKDAVCELSLRRQLVALIAMMEAEKLSIESRIEIGENWPASVLTDLRQEDMVVCFPAPYPGFDRRPLHQFLSANLNCTVYMFDGVAHRETHSFTERASSLMAWGGSIGLVFAFFWLQAKIVQLPQDWVHTSMLYFSLFAEVGAILGWNALFD